MLLSEDIVVQIVRLAEESKILSIKGVAFWAINILSYSEKGNFILFIELLEKFSLSGATALASLGWESNKFRRIVEKAETKAISEDSTPARKSTVIPEAGNLFSLSQIFPSTLGCYLIVGRLFLYRFSL